MKFLQLIFITIVTTVACIAQAVTAGVVVDPRGAPVVGARVTCEGGLEATTAEDGHFAIARCAAYKVTVSAKGFRQIEVSPNGTPIVLEPSFVSASVDVTRIDSAINETPASVVSIAREALQNSGSLTLDDRLRQVPGFTLFRRAGSSTANPTTQGVSLRGVGASGASRALVVNDGVPLNDPFGGWVYWGRVPSEAIQGVEMIRGAASDLYGSSAVGGVISIVERSSQTLPFADLDVTYGSERSPFGSFFGGVGIETVRATLGAEAYRTNGFIPTAPESRGPVDTAANVGRYSLRPRLEFRPRSSVSMFLATALYQERRRNGSSLQNNDTRIAEMTLGGDVTTKHMGVFGLRLYGLTEKYHQSFSAIAANRQTESLNRLQTVLSQALGANVQWTRAFGRNAVFIGSDVRQVRGRSDETAIANGIAMSLTSAGGRETTFGTFTGGVIEWKRLTLSGGLRYDAWSNTAGYSATRSITA
ncbi:MAG TPA: TonB-dependent receptor, partial [Pyrinomonadaceae bacterium]|nr:TonB-dependent receptor [Pyrinomonadaceae bacterium]